MLNYLPPPIGGGGGGGGKPGPPEMSNVKIVSYTENEQ